ncbi:MAG TPA: hypothetical protein EYG52_09695 [Pseudomonadales bacterium]|nr:hypothetical protein [Pseudomonadales bacterium]
MNPGEASSLGPKPTSMQIAETHVLFLGGLIVLLCTASLLPIRTRAGASWILYLAIAPACLFILYESLLVTLFVTIDIRIDLLIIGLLLIAVVRKTVDRWEVVFPSQPGPVSRLAQSCFVLGLSRIILYQLVVVSVAAVAVGHIVQIKAETKSRTMNDRLVAVGVALGYINSGLAVFLLVLA